MVAHRRLPSPIGSVMEDVSPLSDSEIPRHRVRHQTLKQSWFYLSLALLSAVCLCITVFFAYNCSLPTPISSKLLFKRPGTSILVLNVLSQVTMFCLAELALCVLGVLRWAFVSHPYGTPAYTFLALSRATNVAGVLYMILGRGPRPGRFQRDGHRVWGIQRSDLALLV